MKKMTQRIKAAKVQTKTASRFASPFMSPGGKRRRPGANELKDEPSAETENDEANVPPGGTTITGKRRCSPPHDVGLRSGKSSLVPDEHAIAAVDEREGSASKRTKSAPAVTSPQRELRRSLRRSAKGSLSPVPVLHSTEKALLDRAARAPAARERARMLKSRQPRAPLKDPLSSFGTPHGHLPPRTPRAALCHAMAARSPATRGGEGGLDARTQLSRRSVARHWLRIESETARAEACVEAERKGNVLRGFGDALVAPLVPSPIQTRSSLSLLFLSLPLSPSLSLFLFLSPLPSSLPSPLPLPLPLTLRHRAQAGLLGGEDDRALLQHAVPSPPPK